MPWTVDDEKKWNETQQKVKERDLSREEEEAKVQTLSNPNIASPEYKQSAGENTRLAEKDFYNKLANSDYMVKVMTDMNNLVNDPTKVISDDTKETIAVLNTQLTSMWQAWKNYTGSFTQITNNYRSAHEEMDWGKAFLDQLNQCINTFEKDDFALLKTSVSDDPAMLSCYTTLKHLEGHYEEMTRGSLQMQPGIKVLDYTDKEPEANMEDLQNYIDKQKAEQHFDEAEVVFEPYEGPLFPHEPSPNDACQGHLGDCYFIASLSSVAAENGKMIRDRIKDDGKGNVYIALNDVSVVKKENPGFFIDPDKDSDYEIKSTPYYIKVKKTIPVIKYYRIDENGEKQLAGREDAFATGSPWVQFMEKGYAVSGFHLAMQGIAEAEGGYYDLNSGTFTNAMTTLFGDENVSHRSVKLGETDADTVFHDIKEALKNHKLITASTTDTIKKNQHRILKNIHDETKELLRNDPAFNALPTKAEKEAVYKNTDAERKDTYYRGLTLGNHGYSVTGALSGQNGDFIVVRNPYADKDFDGSTLIKDGNIDLEHNKIPNGYSVLSKDEFCKWFDQAIIFDVVKGKTHVDPGQDIRKLSNAIFTGLKDSKTFKTSDDFRAFLDSAKQLRDLTKSPICSATTLNDALKDLKEKAEKYLTTRKDHANDFEERNMRCTLAKAAIGMADAYAKADHKNLKQDIRQLNENIITDRLAYAAAKSKDHNEADLKKAQESAKKIMNRLSNDQILKLALKNSAGKLSKALANAKKEIAKKDAKDAKLRAKDEKALKKALNANKPAKKAAPVMK